MAPELLRGAPGDPQSDLYALGVVLFALVTGKLPIEASSLQQLVERHERREVRRARDLRPDIPEAFVDAIEGMLEPDPATRVRTATSDWGAGSSSSTSASALAPWPPA